MTRSDIKIVKVLSTSEPRRTDIRTSLNQHRVACTERCMALTDAGTRHLFKVNGTWVDSSGQMYS